MLFELSPAYQEIAIENCDPAHLTAGAFTIAQLPMLQQRFGFSEQAIAQCLSEQDQYRNSVDVFDDYTFCVLTMADATNPLSHPDKVALFFERNLLLMVTLADDDGSAEALFMRAAARHKPEVTTMEKVVAAVLEGFIEGNAQALAAMAFEINEMEQEVATGSINRQCNAEVFERRKQLLHLRNYYEQLLDIGEELLENENDIFQEGSLHYIAMFIGRVERLSATVQLLRDSLTQLREAYQAALDYNLNRVIKTLTVLATLYLPPTFIAGWYGMNFRHMPELDWWFGYPLVIALSLALMVGSLLYFKRRKIW